MAACKVTLQFSECSTASDHSVKTATLLHTTFLVITENVMPLCTLFPEIMGLEM